MPVDTDGIMQLLRDLSSDERLKVTINECVKCGLIIGGASAIGGILFGPIGMAVCGCIGSCAAALTSQNKVVSVVEILSTMDSEKREALAENVERIMRSVNVTDVLVFANMVADNNTLKQQVTAELVNFLNKEMQMAVTGQ